ncbi:hypothetical protein GGH96_003573 [Coemansia sp. RSA 1972]|nr:hypothetical protein GGH96_003573 [Coemansia sp. RSA 1972]
MSDISSSARARINCSLCNTDLTPLGAAARNAHVEECLDTSVIVPASVPDRSTLAESDDLSVTLARLDDCPVCGKIWTVSVTLRPKHAKTCAAQHGLSSKDLTGLIEMFRESLGEPSLKSSHSTKSTTASHSSSFLRAFSPQPQKLATAKGSARSKGKRTVKQAFGGIVKPIDSWFGRQSSEEPESINSDIGALSRSQSRSAAQSPASLFVCDLSEDEDFQSTKPRIPLRQSAISVRRVGKKRQEVLDEFDDELNEAKALSLSLTRTPDATKLSKTPPKRRGAHTTPREMLNRSDILASEEAQSYIRQRAAALERMDAERQSTRQGYSDLAAACAVDASESQSTPTSNLDCDCVDELLGHVLRSLALGSQGPIQAADKNTALLDESSLHEGYTQLLQAVRRGYSRQVAALRCAEWVDAEVDTSPKNDAPDQSIVLLSSSESASSLPESIGFRNISLNAGAQASPVQDTPAVPSFRPPPAPSSPLQNKPAAARAKMPVYAKMSMDELKDAAARYGLRVNTSRRLLLHQLTAIWEQTHKSDAAAGVAATEPSTAQTATQQLHSQLRSYIQGHPDLYERILCYQALDFDSTHRQISSTVPCQKSALRKFFDAEGIVSNSNVGHH